MQPPRAMRPRRAVAAGGTRAVLWRWAGRAVFVAAVVAWAIGIALVLTGDASRGLVIGVPAGLVLLAFAWRRAGFWLPDGGGGP